MPTIKFIAALPGLALAIICTLAVWHDLRTRRIPNHLILAGALTAGLLHALLPTMPAPSHMAPVGQGLLFSMAGFGLGLLLLIPFYALRALGAGDVKLVAVVGAFVGPTGVLGVTLMTMLLGGILALVVALGSGQLMQALANLQRMWPVTGTRRASGGTAPSPGRAATSGKLPYAIAIAGGTAAHLLLTGAPLWRVFS